MTDENDPVWPGAEITRAEFAEAYKKSLTEFDDAREFTKLATDLGVTLHLIQESDFEWCPKEAGEWTRMPGDWFEGWLAKCPICGAKNLSDEVPEGARHCRNCQCDPCKEQRDYEMERVRANLH